MCTNYSEGRKNCYDYFAIDKCHISFRRMHVWVYVGHLLHTAVSNYVVFLLIVLL